MGAQAAFQLPDLEQVTPMMAQYLALKEAHPDYILFFRLGDFYEMFFDDAKKASAALNIALTSRGKHLDEDIAMCGVPWHQAEQYLAKLIEQGFKVAVADQVESPADAKKRGPKSVVKRDVVRLVTPGTLTEDHLLDRKAHAYLMAVADHHGAWGVAWADMSTGNFFTQHVAREDLGAVFSRLNPKEILLPEKLKQDPPLFDLMRDWKKQISFQPDSRFHTDNGERRLCGFYQVQSLDGFGQFSKAEIAAAGVVFDYIDLTQKGQMPPLKTPFSFQDGSVLQIDAATMRNLEILKSFDGTRQGSLLHAIDHTVTGAGARLLGDWLAAPLTDVARIQKRQERIAFFTTSPLREKLRATLGDMPDAQRALSRLILHRGGPRDLAVVKKSLQVATLVREQAHGLPDIFKKLITGLGHHEAMAQKLEHALRDDLPVLARDGGFIAKGFSPVLDEMRSLRDETRRHIVNLQQEYAAQTGIANLKIKHNKVLGYHIDVTPKNADKMQGDFIHRQTLASSVRFTTTQLSDLDLKIMKSHDQALAMELQIFDDLVAELSAQQKDIAHALHVLAVLDVITGLAALAVDEKYVRPVVDNSLAFDVKKGRHPVVEQALRSGAQDFVGNDCDLGGTQKLWVLTGPNMAGKSTFLRQNALILILAQMGCFVPAESAHIGVVDRLFSRVGAADDLARGRSTFMVEMVETAAILNQATEKSLVILDEIGRGTATFDGLSIAWAVVEQLHHHNQSRALFATHYHELTQLENDLPHMACFSMQVKHWDGKIVFLHQVAKGAADQSYGIHVAELAGLPATVIARANQLLESLKQDNVTKDLRHLPAPCVVVEKSAVEQKLNAVDPESLSPREALDLIYNLKKSIV